MSKIPQLQPWIAFVWAWNRLNVIVRWNNFIADSVYFFIMGWFVFVVFCLSWTSLWSVFMQFRLKKIFMYLVSLCIAAVSVYVW